MSSPSRREFLGASAAMLALNPSLESLLPYAAKAPLNVAVIGVGRQGRAILTELGKIAGVKIVALVDGSKGRLDAGLRRAQGAEGFASHKEMLDKVKTVEAVFVATPTHLHREPVVDALSAGKHVYCEAPLAHNMDDLVAITKAARASKSLFQSGMGARSNPIYQLARTFVRSGTLRTMATVRAQYRKKMSWRFPAPTPAEENDVNWRLNPDVSLGLIGEVGVSQFDAVHWFLNAYPVSVRATGAVRLHQDGRKVADTVACEMMFADGVRFAYDATIANSFEGAYELYTGEMASIKLAWNAGWMFKEADAPTQGWEVYANREQFHDEQGITLIADATKLAAQNKLKDGVGLPEPPLYYPVADFVRSVTESKPSVCSADEGYRSGLVVLAAHQALMTGTAQKLSEQAFKELPK